MRKKYNQRGGLVTCGIIKEVILLHIWYNQRSGLVTYVV